MKTFKQHITEIKMHGKPMSARQRSELMSRKDLKRKPVSTRSHEEVEAEMDLVAKHADATKAANGAWPKHLLRKHDLLRRERDTIKFNSK